MKYTHLKAGERQKKLLSKLFKDYNPLERPVEDDNQPLNVSVGLALQQIVDVDEKKQVRKTNYLKHSIIKYNFNKIYEYYKDENHKRLYFLK